ncbi:Clp protease N-terminal domain-containing protein [Cellulomonas rhizosphaerae]|uniref:Clp R domain-containing protein n=1 Tax=Cellulomonas rhizosphaerae TaxID=2293719 RepID=A0A413RR85_9CELL|nr:Clp protease N-terminal domain-containing protein [Cellulomonas rhizosphaerae]RHA44443.1 hypothetical protein D1825_01215 [Cellulomonas rhizosphaerae]
MFERFATEARDAVTGAQSVARSRGDARITSAHLLLALAAEPTSVAALALSSLGVDGPALRTALDSPAAGSLDADALAAIGVDLDAVRAQVEGTFGAGALDRPAPSRGRHIPFAPDAKKVLEQSLRVVVAEKSRRIDTGHLLVAVSLVDDSAGREVLARAGVTAESARAAVAATRAA